MNPPENPVSKCCGVPLNRLPIGQNAQDHWECRECHKLWVYSLRGWTLCQSPEVHLHNASAKHW